VHGFGQDADGELYALVTNTSANGNGGIVYKLVPAVAPAVKLTVERTGNMLDISWPAAGWQLQTQTNSAELGIGTGWFTLPGSVETNHVVVPIDPANSSVFYRLSLP
jgi:hypothetical protein